MRNKLQSRFHQFVVKGISTLTAFMLIMVANPVIADVAATPSPIKIAVTVWSGFAYAYVAQEKGFFKKNHVNVALTLNKATTETLALFTQGDVDGIFGIFADMIMINSQGIPIKIVMVTDYSATADAIIARTGIHSLAGLRDKTVSFEGVNSFSHIFCANST